MSERIFFITENISSNITNSNLSDIIENNRNNDLYYINPVINNDYFIDVSLVIDEETEISSQNQTNLIFKKKAQIFVSKFLLFKNFNVFLHLENLQNSEKINFIQLKKNSQLVLEVNKKNLK